MPHRAVAVATVALLTAACTGGGSAPPGAQDPELVLNGAVDAIAVATDGTAYVGGDFTAVGPFTGHAVVLDPTTGALAAPPPLIGGPSHWSWITAAAADGRGGWYVGGIPFGEGFSGMARLRADGTFDVAFVTSFDGTVETLAVGDGVVYVGGYFDHVGGAARHRLAAVDGTTGAVTAWDPALPGSVAVSALAVAEGTIYAGGGPDPWTAASSGWIAAIDPAGVVSAWSPTIDGWDVRALAVRGRTVFAGGSFTKVDGEPRDGLAAFDPGGALSTWDGGASDVRALAVVGDTLYAGGGFTTVQGEPHAGLVAFDASGAPSTWNPGLDGTAWSLAASGGTLYVGGSFEHAGAARRRNAAAFDASGALLPWDPRANDAVQALAVSGGKVLAGGALTSVGAVSRRGLAAFDAQGRLTTWAPEIDAGRSWTPIVRALTLVGDRVYVGGLFSSVGGAPRESLAAIDRQGNILDGTPEVSGIVFALGEHAGAIYVGGRLDRVGGVPRRGLASFDPAAGGSVLAFDPGLAPTGAAVYALASRGSTLYVGGAFSAVAGVPRGNGAAFDATGALLPWDPAASGSSRTVLRSVDTPAIHALATSDRGVYVGGTFTELGDRARRSAGLVDAVTGAASDWDAGIDAELPLTELTDVWAILPQGTDVYLGGALGSVGGMPRVCAARVDAATGAVMNWTSGGTSVFALAADGGRILIGDGNGFTTVAP